MNYLQNLKVLREAVANEPAHLFDLFRYEQSSACGTLHCTAGLACTLPYFQQQGLQMICGAPYMEGASDWESDSMHALNTLFQAFPEQDGDTYDFLFAERGEGMWDSFLGTSDMSDKELALARLDRAIELWSQA